MSRNTKDDQCAICQQKFNINNIAWIISFCGHNLCNRCLKKSITSEAREIFCRECNKSLSVDEETLEQFPKNITILKSLKESQNNSIISSGSKHTQKQNSENSLLFNESNIKYITNNCPKHGKPLEIVCTLDRNLLCSHCAIFGEHQNHVFKTLDQFTGELLLFRQNFNEIELKRQICEDSVRGKKFKTSIIAKISDKKDRLFFDIKEKFAKLTAAIKDAENKVFEELVKCFRNVDSQISRAIKQQQDVEKHYSRWKKQIVDYVNLVDEVVDIKSKIQVFYRPNRPTLHEGQCFLRQLQENNKSFQSSVEQKINSIKIDYLGNIEGSIYNYAKVCTNTNQVKLKHQQDNFVYSDINEIKIPKKEMKIQFVKSDLVEEPKQVFLKKQELHKAPKSPILAKVKSNPKLTKPSFESPRKPKTPPKHQQNSLHTNESNKHEENRYFAERQLYQFLHSSDTLDITGCQLTDEEILHIVEQGSRQKPIKCIKLCKNKLTNHGLSKIISYLAFATNINLSYNSLTDDCVDIFIEKREQIPSLRIINLTHNKLNERKVKTKIEQLRKVGIITTL